MLSTELLPNGQRYIPLQEHQTLFRMWQLYAFDSLFTYALEMALRGFLEELHKHDEMTESELTSHFSDCEMLKKNINSLQELFDHLLLIKISDSIKFEEDLINSIEISSGKQRIAFSFYLYCYCQICFQQIKAQEDSKDACAFFTNLASWDSNELTLLQTIPSSEEYKLPPTIFLLERFLKDWVVQRQLQIRTQRKKEMGWFSFNSETKTYSWESLNNANLYRADRLPNLMGFLLNLTVIKVQNNSWYIELDIWRCLFK